MRLIKTFLFSNEENQKFILSFYVNDISYIECPDDCKGYNYFVNFVVDGANPLCIERLYQSGVDISKVRSITKFCNWLQSNGCKYLKRLPVSRGSIDYINSSSIKWVMKF